MNPKFEKYNEAVRVLRPMRSYVKQESARQIMDLLKQMPNKEVIMRTHQTPTDKLCYTYNGKAVKRVYLSKYNILLETEDTPNYPLSYADAFEVLDAITNAVYNTNPE